MQIVRTIRLIWTFYKSFLFSSLVITAWCVRIYWRNDFSGFFGVFWLKILSLGLSYYFVNDHKKQEYYYYQNLGVSKTLLWSVSLSVDFILYLFLLIQIYQFK